MLKIMGRQGYQQKAKEKLDEIIAKRKSPHQARIEMMNQLIAAASGDKTYETPDKPVIPSAKMRLVRAKLILEEALEAVEALGFDIKHNPDLKYGAVNFKDLRLVERGTITNDGGVSSTFEPAPINLADIAKELADVSVVAIGTFSACGIADMPILEEVDYNNLSKFGVGGKLVNGKWHKPPDHQKPDIQKLLDQQVLATEAVKNEPQEAKISDVPISSGSEGQAGESKETCGIS